MAVKTTNNKPLNPRGQDQSPLAFNRAKLYSGKALDFDGVNDYVDIGSFSMSGNNATFVFNYNQDAAASGKFVFDNEGARLSIGQGDVSGSFGVDTGSIAWEYFGSLESGKWYGIAVIIEGSTARCYANGVAFGDAVDIGETLNFANVTNATIGARYSKTASNFDGQLSGFKIFNTALTAAQVADLYNNPEKIVPTGVADSALKLWLPMQEGAGTTCYNGAPDALGSNVVTNGTFDDDLDDWTTNTASNGSIAYDNGTALVTSNGGTGYPSIHQRVSTTVGERYIVKANFSNNTTGAWFWKHDDDSGLGGTNRVKFFDNDTSSSIDAIFEFTATSTLSTISAFAEQGDAGSFNLDNVEVLPMSNIGTISGATWTHGIGAPVSQTAVINWNKHILAGVGQTQNEILFPEGLTVGRDLLGNLFENVRKQGALNLDGNSWAEVHDNGSFDLTLLSLECWFYADSSAASDGLLGQWSGSQGYLLYLVSSSDVRFFINGTARIYSTALTGWNHIAGVYDGATMKLYINGTQEVSGAHTTDPTLISAPIEIGRFGESVGTQYPNQIAQPRIYNRALTAEEVQRNYDAGKNIYK